MATGTRGTGIPMVGGHLLLTKVQISSVLTIHITCKWSLHLHTHKVVVQISYCHTSKANKLIVCYQAANWVIGGKKIQVRLEL